MNTTNYLNWVDKNKFKKILDIIESNKFNHKNKIGEFKYNDIKDLVNNIKNNTISEIDAKKDLNTLNKIKNAEIIKYKKRTSTQKELLNLFNDLLKTILINNDNANDNDNNDSDNDNDNNDNDNDNGNDNENVNVNMIKQLNDSLDKMIDESKSFEEQIKLFKKVESLNEYWHCRRYGGKELKFKSLKQILQTVQISLMKSYLQKYLVTHL